MKSIYMTPSNNLGSMRERLGTYVTSTRVGIQANMIKITVGPSISSIGTPETRDPR